ncbi:MAG TPA: hypothetical protein VME41_16270 [Stellaceae bacterium]|nr:hypothetical protein [Stellaceae bacterium]
MRRLHARGLANHGIAVDADGAVLGPDCVLVRRATNGYRSLGRDDAAAMQAVVFGGSREADWLFERCRSIAAALQRREVAFAQILGLHILSGDLSDAQLRCLSRAGSLMKWNFDPDEPRIPTGNPDGGEWTTGDGTDAEAGDIELPPLIIDAPPAQPPDIPAQLPIPWDVPTDIPWDIPGLPNEITPIPFDFPGAERRRPPLPTNPFPRDPECAEEWAAAYRYCDKMETEGKFRPGYSGPGKDMRSCLLGQVSERCGGNPTA